MEHSISNFVAWFELHGGVLDSSIESVCFPHGNSLRVRKGLLPIDSRIVTCPHALTISYINARTSRFLEPLNVSTSISQIVAVRFFLVQQLLLKQDSFWWPYIQTLPGVGCIDDLKTPMWFTKEDLKWIECTNLAKAAMARKRAWQQEYEDAKKLLKESRDSPNLDTWTWFVLQSETSQFLS